MVMLALGGCSADGIHDPQNFFPGSSPTSWESCDKFGSASNQVQICASTGLEPGLNAPSYNINFSLPDAAHVLIAVFDSHAARVRVLLNDDEPATLPGQFRTPPVIWTFTDDSGKPVPPGHYRVYFQSGDFTSTSDVETP